MFQSGTLPPKEVAPDSTNEPPWPMSQKPIIST